MESNFFNLYEKLSNFELEVGHTSITDWMICITDKSTQKTIMVQHCDRKKVFAMAYDKLTDYLLETKGGY